MSDYEAALDRVAAHLQDCADDESAALLQPCSRHPVYVSDIWTLYCAHRPSPVTPNPTEQQP